MKSDVPNDPLCERFAEEEKRRANCNEDGKSKSDKDSSSSSLNKRPCFLDIVGAVESIDERYHTRTSRPKSSQRTNCEQSPMRLRRDRFQLLCIYLECFGR